MLLVGYPHNKMCGACSVFGNLYPPKQRPPPHRMEKNSDPSNSKSIGAITMNFIYERWNHSPTKQNNKLKFSRFVQFHQLTSPTKIGSTSRKTILVLRDGSFYGQVVCMTWGTQNHLGPSVHLRPSGCHREPFSQALKAALRHTTSTRGKALRRAAG